MANLTEQEQWLRQQGMDVDQAKSRMAMGEYQAWVNQTYNYNMQGGDALRDKEAWLGAQGFNTAEYKNRLGAGYADWVNQTYDYNNKSTGRGRGTSRNPVTTGGTSGYGGGTSGGGSTYTASSNPFQDILNRMNSLDPNQTYIDDISSSFTNNIMKQYGLDTAEALKYLKKAGEQGIAGYQGLSDFYNQSAAQINSLASKYVDIAEQTYGTAANKINQYAQTGAQGILDAYNTGANTSDLAAQRALEASQKGAQGQLADTDKMLSYYKSLAAQNQLPGQSLIEQSLGQNTAEAVRRMKEMGGSSLALLGGAANIYGNQQTGIRDLGIQAAQYQAGNQAALANAATGAIGLRAGAWNQMAGAQTAFGQNAQQTAAMRGLGQQASANMLTGAAYDAANLYGTAQERALANKQSAFETGVGWQATGKEGLTQAKMDASGNLAGYYSTLSTQTSNLLQDLMTQRIDAETKQADLNRRALIDQASMAESAFNAKTQAENDAWLKNQYEQWANWFNYSSSGAGMDTSAAASSVTEGSTEQWLAKEKLRIMKQQMWLDMINSAADSFGEISNTWGEKAE